MPDDTLITVIYSLIPLLIGILIVSILPYIFRWKKLEEVIPGITGLFKKYDITQPRIYVKKDDYINAFAVILAVPPYTVVTSRVIDLFDSKEIFAILLHEIGHHSNKDSISSTLTISFLMFYLMLIPFYIFLSIILIVLNRYDLLLWTLLVLFLSRTILAWLLTPLLRKNEKNADLYASKILGKNKIWLISALNRLENATKNEPKKISILRLLRRAFCLIYFDPFLTHPSTPERIKYIRDSP